MPIPPGARSLTATKARVLKLERLVLYSHTRLAPAINLYFKKGFRVIPKLDHHNDRANIKMERLC